MTAGGAPPERGAGPDGLSILTRGSGPGVLWLHGYTMDSVVWRDLWARLPGFRHVGIDLPWHGGSRGLRPAEDLATLADLVTDWVEETNARRPPPDRIEHVVGMSFGSILGLELALRRPESFRTWVLAAPAIVGAAGDPDVERRYLDVLSAYREHGPTPALARLWMRPPPDVFAGVLARPQIASLVYERVMQHRWDELNGMGTRQLLDRSQDIRALHALDRAAASTDGDGPPQTRLLVVIGQQELPVHRANAERLVAGARATRLHVVPAAGHLALIEEPASVAPILRAHWEGVSR